MRKEKNIYIRAQKSASAPKKKEKRNEEWKRKKVT